MRDIQVDIFTLAGKVSILISVKWLKRSEAKSAKRSFALKIKIQNILTRSFASRFKLRYAQPILANFR